LAGRKVKKSLKMRRCVTTPVSRAMNISMVATPTTQRLSMAQRLFCAVRSS